MPSQDSEFIEWWGNIGIVLTIILFLSPIREMLTFQKKQSVGSYRCELYVVTWVSTSAWIVYAIDVGLLDPLIANGSGLGLSSVYCVLYTYYAWQDRAARLLVVKEWISGALLLGFAFLIATLVNREIDVTIGTETFASVRALVFGALCVVLNAGMYSAPLSVMKMVIDTKQVEGIMPFWPSFLTTLVSVNWAVYAWLVGSLTILIPNVAGVVVGIVQLLLYTKYMNHGRKNGSRRGGLEGYSGEEVGARRVAEYEKLILNERAV